MKRRNPDQKARVLKSVAALMLAFVFFLGGCGAPETGESLLTQTASTAVIKPSEATDQAQNTTTRSEEVQTTAARYNLSDKKISLSSIPSYSGKAYTAVNENKPFFTSDEITAKAFETYGSLDKKGRCTAALACCGTEIMPGEDEDRASIGGITPTGWVQAEYDNVSGRYLYNRCHLIGWQLSAENANERNLITGTKYLNIEGMLPFENMIADYIKETGYHVMYRVTPIFEGNNLLASGVQLEAYSVEDEGDGICFNVYCYNVQPGILIDYSTGESCAASQQGSSPAENKEKQTTEKEKTETDREKETTSAGSETGLTDFGTYILNTNTKKIHTPDCSSVNRIQEQNKESYSGSLQTLMAKGYTKCAKCF